MRIIKIIPCFVLFSFFAVGFSQDFSLAIDKTERYFTVDTPSVSLKDKKLPLIIALHDFNSNVNDFGTYTGLTEKAKTNGFIIVYPKGTVNENGYYIWNAGNIYEEWSHRANDVKFVDSLIKFVERKFPIDSNRIYVTGYSNGAMMAYRLAAELSGKIAAIACVAGPMVDLNAKPKFPVAVMHIHGDADLIVPHTGTEQYGFQMASIDEVLRKWLKWDSCSTVPVVLKYEPKLTALKWKGKADVQLYLLHGFGHDWPSKERGNWPATDYIIEFFKSVSKESEK